MKQQDNSQSLKSLNLTEEDLQQLSDFLDNEGYPSDKDNDSEEIDPFSGVPIDYTKGYDPYHTPKQISIRRCLCCRQMFDSFVGIKTMYCNRCRTKLGLDILPEASIDYDAQKIGYPKPKTQKHKNEKPEQITQPKEYTNFSDKDLFAMLSGIKR